MGKYIDADKLIAEIEKHIKEVKDAVERFIPNMGIFDAKLSGIYDVMAIIDSLQQEPIEKDEETEKLIVCDIIEATIARINGGKKDEEKEENIMREKIAYLRDLGLKNNDN